MGERLKIVLVCEVCGGRNYKRTKARRDGDDKRLEFQKFCPACRQHTLHKESR